MTPEEAERILALFEDDGTTTTSAMITKLYGQVASYDMDNARKRTWSKLHKMAEEGIIRKTDEPNGMACRWVIVGA